MTLAEEFKSRNFSIYGQCFHGREESYMQAEHVDFSSDMLRVGTQDPRLTRLFYRTGVLCFFLCFALGIANIFHLGLLILFSIICLVSSFVILFVEVPLLLRICPTSAKFDAFIRRFTTNYMRAAIYGIMSLIQWLSILADTSSLIAAAVVLLVAGVFYALAGLKNQQFVGSKTLGGQGVAQMIV